MYQHTAPLLHASTTIRYFTIKHLCRDVPGIQFSLLTQSVKQVSNISNSNPPRPCRPSARAAPCKTVHSPACRMSDSPMSAPTNTSSSSSARRPPKLCPAPPETRRTAQLPRWCRRRHRCCRLKAQVMSAHTATRRAALALFPHHRRHGLPTRCHSRAARLARNQPDDKATKRARERRAQSKSRRIPTPEAEARGR